MKDALLARKLDWAGSHPASPLWSCADGRPDWGWFRWGGQLHAWWQGQEARTRLVRAWPALPVNQLLLREDLDPGYLPLNLGRSFDQWACFLADFSPSSLKSNLSEDDRISIPRLEDPSRIERAGFFRREQVKLLSACGCWLGLEDGEELEAVILQAFPLKGEVLLEAWAVRPASRGQGLGSRLFRAACTGCRRVRLLRQKPDSALQEALGFRREAGYRRYGQRN